MSILIESLTLEANSFTGHIPSELAKITTLEEIFIRRNFLTGKIPVEFANLSNLRVLDIFHNDLSVTLLGEICNLPKLYSFYADENDGNLECQCCREVDETIEHSGVL
jgi:hypothetical protein